jgi:hypothetical protein
METTTIHSLAEFTELIEKTCADQSYVLFRGQNGDFPLLPSIARERLTDDILAVERSMLDEFQRHSLPFLRVRPSKIWEWAALAQHHGLPTRLLDWSSNPLTSLWFAVNRRPSKDGTECCGSFARQTRTLLGMPTRQAWNADATWCSRRHTPPNGLRRKWPGLLSTRHGRSIRSLSRWNGRPSSAQS